MSSLTMLEAIKETERIGKEYTDRKVQEAAGNGGGGSAGNYPPYSGIPRDDLSRDVRNSLELADSALQPGVAETTYQKKGNYPTKTEMAEAIAAAQMGAGSGAPVNATAIKYTPEGGEETTVAEALTLLSEEKEALSQQIANIKKLDLEAGEDGKIYITINGVRVGDGIELGSGTTPTPSKSLVDIEVTLTASNADEGTNASTLVSCKAVYDDGSKTAVTSFTCDPSTLVFGQNAVVVSYKQISKTVSVYGVVTVASYWQSNYTGARNWLASKSGVKGIFVTDTHYGRGGNFAHSQSIRTARRIQNEQANVYFIHGGDITDNYTNEATSRSQWAMAVADGIELYPSRTMLVSGNHEMQWIDTEMIDIMNGVSTIGTNAGWYKDIGNVRIIGLMNYKYYDSYIDTALNGVGDKYVLLLTHYTPPIDSAFTLNYSGFNALYNKLIPLGERYIGHLTGHQHVDRVMEDEKFITFCCDRCENDGDYAGYTYPNRVLNTLNEGSFTCFNIDTANKRVEFKRFGAATTYNGVTLGEFDYSFKAAEVVEPDDEDVWTHGKMQKFGIDGFPDDSRYMLTPFIPFTGGGGLTFHAKKLPASEVHELCEFANDSDTQKPLDYWSINNAPVGDAGERTVTSTKAGTNFIRLCAYEGQYDSVWVKDASGNMIWNGADHIPGNGGSGGNTDTPSNEWLHGKAQMNARDTYIDNPDYMLTPFIQVSPGQTVKFKGVRNNGSVASDMCEYASAVESRPVDYWAINSGQIGDVGERTVTLSANTHYVRICVPEGRYSDVALYDSSGAVIWDGADNIPG